MAGGYIDPYGFSKGAKAAKGGDGGGGGYVDPYGFSKSPKAAKAAKPHHGGGIGGFFHSVGHFVGSKAGLAAHDIAGMPGGIYQLGKDSIRPGVLELEGKDYQARRAAHHFTHGDLVGGFGKGTYESVRHPFRDPFQTALTVIPAVDVAGRIGEAGIAASDAARAGEGASRAGRAAARTLTRHGETPPTRVLRVGEDRTRVNLLASKNAGVRLAQRGYDRMVQRALDREAAGQQVGRATARVAKHGMKRATGALAEEQRIEQKLRLVPADMLDRSAKKILTKPSTRRENQAALELTSTQTPPEAAAAYHYGQAQKGVNPARNMALGKVYEGVAKRNLVHVDESLPAGRKVHINPAHENLARVDARLAEVQQRGDTMLTKHEVMTPEQLQERVNAPARIRAGATYEKPTPGKAGVPSAKLEFRRAEVARLQAASDRAAGRVQRMKFTAADQKRIGNGAARPVDVRDAEGPKARVIAGDRPHVITAGGDIVRPIGANHAERIGAALSVAKDRLQQAEAAAERRVQPTGIVGGDQALPGRGFVSGRVAQKRLARAEAASSKSAVTGEVRSPIDKKPYTGRALEQGLVPKSVTREASQHYRQIARFEATDALRKRAIATGSTVRRSNRDVLIRVPGTEGGKVGAQTREILGLERSTVDTPEELAATQEGLGAAHRMFIQHMLDKVATSKDASIGVKADKGYRWVDENTIKGLQDEARPKGGAGAGLGRAVDNVNSAVTSLTVYFKVGHVGTRVLTNAATNIIQGSMNPLEFGKSIRLWKSLSDEEKARMLAASGQHGFSALPHEGSEGAFGRAIAGSARGGARFWARHADAPFRFNGLAYELRKAGYTSAADVRRALDGLESGGHGLPAHEWSKISAAARRADRELISYDRLNPFEKRYLTRGIWFYPWVKGSTVFTVRSFLEHPYKAAAFGAAARLGVNRQEKLLGEVPSYEEGLVPLGGGKHPETVDFSTFSPFSTAGNLVNAFRIPGQIPGQFNPAVGAAGQYVYGLNQYGAPSTHPGRDALLALAAATPEQQLAEAYAARHENQSQRIFKKTPGGTIERFVLGPGFAARRTNRAALARAAKRERSGQR